MRVVRVDDLDELGFELESASVRHAFRGTEDRHVFKHTLERVRVGDLLRDPCVEVRERQRLEAQRVRDVVLEDLVELVLALRWYSEITALAQCDYEQMEEVLEHIDSLRIFKAFYSCEVACHPPNNIETVDHLSQESLPGLLVIRAAEQKASLQHEQVALVTDVSDRDATVRVGLVSQGNAVAYPHVGLHLRKPYAQTQGVVEYAAEKLV